ncbi:uncharacterized protein [Asterias amurensis]|uniref:uncharacterized protein isoform X3 n=1 Tax=Asterias amurensis TaxID=7602 RepID=UPI003AB881C3
MMTYAQRRFVCSLVCCILITMVSAQEDDIDCPNDIEQNAIHGENGTVVDWPNITEGANVTVECFNQDEEMVESGDAFPIGETIVHCMNEMNETCEFSINITECKPCVNGSSQNDTCACECDEGYQGLLCDVCTPKECANGMWDNSTCECECLGGFEGELCTECVTEKDCMNGGTFINATCECECPDWFEGEVCEECTPKNCGENGKLNNTSCKCDCVEGFEGELCAVCSPKECTNGNWNDLTCKCDCKEGFKGELCTQCKECLNDGGNQNTSTCACDCPELFIGVLCGECATEKDCMNGGTFINATCECECPDWFEGEVCEECTPKNCGENGKLNNTSCKCDCVEGFEGELCAVCSPKECTNGNWNDLTCKCDCKEGFKGELCTQCKECLNDGGNQNTSTCACDCPELFIGVLCGECVTEKDCMNGGTFINATCACECPDWFEGELCEECTKECLNGQLDNTTCGCNCDDGFQGELCTECKECLNDGGKQNNSTCACECPELFIGLLCEDCLECENGGTLQNLYTCECECPGRWTGPLCTVCPQWLKCMNGGTPNITSCFCECTEDWTGADCSKAVPSFPDDQYAEVEGEKTVQIEIAVTSDSDCNATDNATSEECKTLVDEFKKEVEKLYQSLLGFKEVIVNLEKLRQGSVIIPHNVTYDYAKMSQEGRQLSAVALYDMTVGPAVSEGMIGALSVSPECAKCIAPEDFTDTCNEAIDCGKGFEEYKMTEGDSCYLICQSICQTSICGDGTCSQEQGSDVVTCRCPQTSEVMYIGSNCQLKIELLWLYVGCGVGGGLFLLLIVILTVCVIRCNNENKKLKKGHGGKKTDNELRVEVQAVHNNGFVDDSTAATEDAQGNTSSLTRARPYSYIYGKEEGVNGVSRSNSGAAQRNSRYEAPVDREQQQPQYVDDLAQQQRSSYFWGNLSDPVKEETELIPMVRGIDPSKMYKIQRPQIAMGKQDDLPERDYF